MSVPWVRVGDVLWRRLDQVPVEPLGTYRLLGVRNQGRGAFDSGEISGSATSYRFLYRAHAGDLVYLKLGAWERAFSTVPDELDGHCASSEFVMYEPDESRLDRRYLTHLVGWDGVVTGIGAKSTGTNVRRRRLKPETFEVATIPLPDLDEQRRIAARLDAIAVVVSSVEGDASQKIRQLYAGVFAHITPGRPLGDLLVLDDTECVVDRETTYRRVGVRSHGRGLFLQPPLDGSSTSYGAMRVVRSGQVVLSRLKAFEGAVGMAEADHEGAVVSPEFHTFRLRRPELDTFYVRALIRLPSVWEQLKAASTGVGARRERVRAEALLAVEVPIPSGDERRRVAVQCQAIERVEALWGHRQRVARALLPAARNEEFSRLTSA